MYKILVALLPFIRELFFDKEEEMVLTSSKFNIKKWVVFFLFILGCAYAITVTNSLLSISTKFLDLSKRYHKLEILEKNEHNLLNTTVEKNKEMTDEINDLKNKCANTPPDTPNKKPDPSKVKKSGNK